LGIITTRGDGKFDPGDCKKFPIGDSLKETTNNPTTQENKLVVFGGGEGCSMLRRSKRRQYGRSSYSFKNELQYLIFIRVWPLAKKHNMGNVVAYTHCFHLAHNHGYVCTPIVSIQLMIMVTCVHPLFPSNS